MYQLGQRSLQRLGGVHPDLVAVVEMAIQRTEQDFSVLEGVRSYERQKMLLETGKSTTMNSRHLTGHAVDVAPYPLTWDWDYFYPIADAFIQAAKDLNTPIRWGGNWQVRDVRNWEWSSEQLNLEYRGDFPDAPHIEIPRGYGYE